MKLDSELTRKILAENIRVHTIEAKIYEKLHPEIFNWYEQKATWKRLQLLDRLTAASRPRRALDLGCGTGNLLLKLAKLGFSVTGVDISQDMLNRLSNYLPSSDIHLVYSDIDSFLTGYTGVSFDVIAFSSVLHHLPDYMISLGRATQLLADGGVIYITHKPVKSEQSERNSLSRKAQHVVSRLSQVQWRVILRLEDLRVKKVDYSLSDYHAKVGIPVNTVRHFFRERKFHIIEIRYYVAEKSGWAAWLNDRVLGKHANNLSIIAQKVTT